MEVCFEVIDCFFFFEVVKLWMLIMCFEVIDYFLAGFS